MQIKCDSKRLSQRYRELIGELCFGDREYFDKQDDPFTLNPLIIARDVDYDWCRIAGIEAVRLSSVTIQHLGSLEIRKTNGDYFPALVECNLKRRKPYNIIEATFTIKQVQ